MVECFSSKQLLLDQKYETQRLSLLQHLTLPHFLNVSSTFDIASFSPCSPIYVASIVRSVEQITISTIAFVVGTFPFDLVVTSILPTFPPLVVLHTNGLINGRVLTTP